MWPPINLWVCIHQVVSQWPIPTLERTQGHGPRTCGGPQNMPRGRINIVTLIWRTYSFEINAHFLHAQWCVLIGLPCLCCTNFLLNTLRQVGSVPCILYCFILYLLQMCLVYLQIVQPLCHPEHCQSQVRPPLLRAIGGWVGEHWTTYLPLCSQCYSNNTYCMGHCFWTITCTCANIQKRLLTSNYLFFNFKLNPKHWTGTIDLIQRVYLLNNLLQFIKRVDTETKYESTTLLTRL